MRLLRFLTAAPGLVLLLGLLALSAPNVTPQVATITPSNCAVGGSTATEPATRQVEVITLQCGGGMSFAGAVGGRGIGISTGGTVTSTGVAKGMWAAAAAYGIAQVASGVDVSAYIDMAQIAAHAATHAVPWPKTAPSGPRT